MKLYIICHTWRDTDMTIEHFKEEEDAMNYLISIAKNDYPEIYNSKAKTFADLYEEYANLGAKINKEPNYFIVAKLIEL